MPPASSVSFAKLPCALPWRQQRSVSLARLPPVTQGKTRHLGRHVGSRVLFLSASRRLYPFRGMYATPNAVTLARQAAVAAGDGQRMVRSTEPLRTSGRLPNVYHRAPSMQELRQMAQFEALPPVEAVVLAGPASHRCGMQASYEPLLCPLHHGLMVQHARALHADVAAVLCLPRRYVRQDDPLWGQLHDGVLTTGAVVERSVAMPSCFFFCMCSACWCNFCVPSWSS